MKVSILWISPLITAALSFALPLSSQEIPTIGETIDVRVVNVEAVITTASGERVRGLSAADFRLLVDGREVSVDYFAEIDEGVSTTAADTAPVAAGEEVGRNYLIYVDDTFSLADRRNALLEKLERDLALLGPADRMAILAFGGKQIDVLSGWSGDPKALKKALAEARQRPADGAQMLAHQRKLQADVTWLLDNADSLESGDSDRVGGFPVSEVGESLKFMAERKSGEARSQLGKTTDAITAALRGFETPPGRKLMLLLSGAWSLTVAPQLYGSITQAANRLGYTVYPVDASQSDASQVTLLDKLARGTGGRLLSSADNAVFREAVADSGTYYWLGFTPAWKADDRGHYVTVEVRRPGLVVRSRNSFSDLSHRTEASLKAESVLLFGGAQDDRRLLVELGEPTRLRGVFEVPVTIGVPVEAFALTPRGKGYLATVPLAVAAEEKDGTRSNLSGISLKVVVAEPPPAGTYARFKTVVRVRDPGQRLIFSVRDRVNGNTIWGEAQPMPAK